MGIARAQAEAIAAGFLDKIGSAPPTTAEFPVVEQVLAEAAEAFLQDAIANLNKTHTIATGELATSLTFQVDILGSSYLLSVGYPADSAAAKYWDFVNKGVQGYTGQGAPGSPYKFKSRFVSKKMALAILKWYRHQGAGARNVRTAVSGLEKKRVALRDTIKKTDQLKSLAYATAAKIKRDGREPTHFFDNAVASSFGPTMMGALATALAADVILKIRQFGDND